MADYGLVGLPRASDHFPYNDSLVSLKREYNRRSFGMMGVGGGGGVPADKEANWTCGVANGTRPFSHNGLLAPLEKSATERVGEVLSPAASVGAGK